VYRVEQIEEVVDLALAELLDSDAVTLIEWGTSIRGVLGADYLEIQLSLGEDDDERYLRFHEVGSAWAGRQRTLAEALAPWIVDDRPEDESC
jgi:tRNA A37 threonylcarbamoyladenosine biosynthesis protein TsaE